ncbi:MAG: alanine:cation symporter family protein, partial [Bacteroidaceae bacterium]|nr:alanine:cation symporter family protein [Bacteroidaceae bacterium]
MLSRLSDFLWSYVLIAALLGCGLWFTWKTRFVQFRMVGEMFRLLFEPAVTPAEAEASDSKTTTSGKKSKSRKHHRNVSSFQAFAVSVATRVGTGNLAGVATAIAIGGPGAVFWMWVTALIGAATAFVESTLGQLFKQRHRDSFIGGPAYYIRRGLHSRWLSVLFALLLTITFGLSYNSIQSNTICGAMEQAFGWSPLWVGIVLTVASLVIVFGGIRRIARVSSVLVPVMAIGYFVLALVIIGMNIDQIPHLVRIIFADAFGLRQAV